MSKKRQRLTLEESMINVEKKAKFNALNMLESCLSRHNYLDIQSRNSFLSEISNALGIVEPYVPKVEITLSSSSSIISTASTEHIATKSSRRHKKNLLSVISSSSQSESTTTTIPTPTSSSSIVISSPNNTNNSNNSKRRDEHNEVCEVCEIGGDLLCCDTCNLVFHLACLRPKIASIPKGQWSCVYCIIEGVASSSSSGQGANSIEDSKISRDKMERLGNRITRNKNDSLTATENSSGTSTRASSGSSSGNSGIMSTSSCTNRDNISNVTAATTNNSHSSANNSSSNSQSTYQSRLTISKVGKFFMLNNAESMEIGRFHSMEGVCAQLKRYIKTKTYPTTRLADTERVESDSLWCTHCIDDPAITVCVFCGCQVCFGKHNSNSLLLCDGCDNEYHTYCLEPKLEKIPQDKWFCTDCVSNGIAATAAAAAAVEKSKAAAAAVTTSSAMKMMDTNKLLAAGNNNNKTDVASTAAVSKTTSQPTTTVIDISGNSGTNNSGSSHKSSTSTSATPVATNNATQQTATSAATMQVNNSDDDDSSTTATPVLPVSTMTEYPQIMPSERRGRGRPVGKMKRTGSVSSTEGYRHIKLSSANAIDFRHTSNNTHTHAQQPVKPKPVVVSVDTAVAFIQNKEYTITPPPSTSSTSKITTALAAPTPAPTHAAASSSSSSSSSVISFSPQERMILEQLRRWSPLEDLKTVLNALENKRSELILKQMTTATTTNGNDISSSTGLEVKGETAVAAVNESNNNNMNIVEAVVDDDNSKNNSSKNSQSNQESIVTGVDNTSSTTHMMVE